MDASMIIIWVCIGIDVLVVLCLAGYGVYLTWFDTRLRVIMFNSRYGMSISKHDVKDDKMFSKDLKKYVVDKTCIYRRFFKIPYSLYFENNPNPIKIEPSTSKAVYTSQELYKILDVNFTMNLIRGNPTVKKFVVGTVVVIGILAVIMMILHFTGVVDLQTFFMQQPPKP